jgi:hypothetical protein
LLRGKSSKIDSDLPRIMLSEPGHRDVVMGAIMMVLDATTLNPTDAFR